jgi:hypothetical protein
MVLVVDTGAQCASHAAAIPLGGTVNAIVNWGDGTSSHIQRAKVATHTYAVPSRSLVASTHPTAPLTALRI